MARRRISLRLEQLEDRIVPSTYTLGLIEGLHLEPGLSIDPAGEVDTVEFSISDTGEAGHLVEIDFDHSLGDLDMVLFDGVMTEIDSSLGSGNIERISLEGLAAGDYVLRVSGFAGAANDYDLTISAPGGEVADAAESNDSMPAAFDLGQPEGEFSLQGLTITGGDNDWFMFEMLADGTRDNYARVEFSNALGNLDLEMYDADGSLIDLAAGFSDNETIPLANLRAGLYYLHVFGFDGDSNPQYAVAINAPLSDAFVIGADASEPNDALVDAFDLGALEGVNTRQNLSIHEAGNDDWFEFDILAAGADAHSVRIDFLHSLGDLDIELYDDAAVLVGSSEGVGDSESISLDGLAAGTYYARVYGWADATNPDYSLTVSAPVTAFAPDALEANDDFASATDLLTVSGTIRLNDLTISAADNDYFTFTTVAEGNRSDFIKIDFAHSLGDLNMILYDDTMDAVRIAASNTSDETISLHNLDAGTYYLQVFGEGGDTNSYDLLIDAPAKVPGEMDDWTIMVYMTSGDLENFAAGDINELEAAADNLPGGVNITVFWDRTAGLADESTGMGSQLPWSTVGRALIAPDSDMDTIATTFDILSERNSGSSNVLESFIEWSEERAPANHYSLILWDHGNGPWGSNFDPESGDFLSAGDLWNALNDADVHFDAVAYDACLMGMTETAFAVNDFTDFLVASQQVIPGGGYDYETAFAALEAAPDMVAGEAFASGLLESYNLEYSWWPGRTLSVIDTAEMSDLVDAVGDLAFSMINTAVPADWTEIADAHDGADFFGDTDFRDVGQFASLLAGSDVNPFIRDAAQNLADAVDDAVVEQISPIAAGSGLSIYFPKHDWEINPAYSSLHAGFNVETDWLNFLQTFGDVDRGGVGATPDWAEYNDSPALAYNLHQLSGEGHSFDGLALHTQADIDWLRFTIGSDGGADDDVTVIYDDSYGDLQLAVYDGNGVLVGQSDTGSGTEAVSLNGESAGEYLVQVRSDAGALFPEYALEIDAPEAAFADHAGANTIMGKACDLGLINSESVLSGFNLAQAAEIDWFSFSVPRTDAVPSTLVIGPVPGAVDDLNVSLYTSEGVLVNQTSGEGDLTLDYVAGGAVTYLVSVESDTGNPHPGYTMGFEPTGEPEVDFNVVATWQSGNATVIALDTQGPLDIEAEDIRVKFRGERVKSVKLTGDDPMDGLAFIFTGATRVDNIKDSRSGDPGDLAFIISDSPVRNISLKSGITGYDVNGMTVGGIDLRGDIDGDGDVDDPLALYVMSGEDAKDRALSGKFTARGTVGGDMVFDGHANKIKVRGGDLDGDVVVRSNAREISIRHGDGNGDVTVDGHLGKYKVKGVYNSALKAYVSGGNISGDVTAETIGELRATGGDLSGTVTATGADSRGWAIRSIGAKRGDVTGDILALTGGIKDFFAKGSRNPFSFEIEYDGGTFSGRAFSAGAINSFKSIRMEGAFLNALSIDKMTVDTDMADSTTLAGYLYGSDFTLGGGDDESNAGSIESVKIKGWLRDSDVAAGATPGASGFFGDGDDVEHDAGEIAKVTIKRGIEIGGDPHGIIATAGTMKFKLGSATTKLVEGQSIESSGLVISII